MDLCDHSQNDNIRKIEDIIDIQKANGNFNKRQVAFDLPSRADSIVSANIAKSLESGLTKSKCEGKVLKKNKKIRHRRGKSPLPDVISWPSDSDITVLRMKLCLSTDIKENVGHEIRGDGLHQLDSSSMVNLATLVLQSQPPSKHNLNEEYLLPLTSWEERQIQSECRTVTEDEKSNNQSHLDKFNVAVCSRVEEFKNTNSYINDVYMKDNRKSKVARFLRLYFCPCCTCLYKLERMNDQPSSYFNSINGF